MTSPERAYLDHAATTALRPAAREAFLAASEVLGNPASQHASGRRARGVLDDALEQIAGDLQVPVSSLILTSGGTESDNLALRGAAAAGAESGAGGTMPIIVAASDHPAVRETAALLGGCELPVDGEGRADLDALEDMLAALPADRAGGAAEIASSPRALVSVAAVNNETGTVQDLAAIGEIARRHGALLHTDAVQAIGHVPLRSFAGADLLSLSGHKLGAPVGIGLLVAPAAIALAPLLTGGGQQRGLRAGTLDAAHAAALAAALHESLEQQETESARLAQIARRIEEGILALDPAAVISSAGVVRSPHIVHARFPGADQDAALLLLDQAGVDASAGSACTAGVTQASHVLAAMGVEEDESRGALRFSLGWTSTRADAEHLLRALPEALERARAVRRLAGRG